MASAAKAKGMPAPLPPPRWTTPDSALTSLLQVSTLLVIAPMQLRATQPAGSGPLAKDYDQAFGENATGHVKQRTQITGSKLEMELEVTIRAEKDGTVYEEQAKGKLTVTICPDAQGNVPLDLTLSSSAGADDKGFEINMAMHAVGHVDDEANLTGWDQDGETELILRTGRNMFGGVNTEQGQAHLGWSVSGMNVPGGKGVSITRGQEGYSLNYLLASQEVKERIQKLATDLSMLELGLAFKSAEIKWQDGFCVAIQVPEGETQEVKAGSETLKSGKVSVTPAGEKVPAPAKFQYKAPDQIGQEAIVELVSRSRRGIGKLNVRFNTEQPYYTVEAPWGSELIRIQGTICTFEKPFTLKLRGRKPGGNFPYTGQVEFTPTDATSGSWLWTGQYTVPYLPPVSDKGWSTYQVTGLSEGNPMIVLSPFTQEGSQPGIFQATHQWPAYEIPIVPESGTCPTE